MANFFKKKNFLEKYERGEGTHVDRDGILKFFDEPRNQSM
jgi:hypothetical protein